jgi:oligopeptide/dipeptide ABC transporter ATP-binding protein
MREYSRSARRSIPCPIGITFDRHSSRTLRTHRSALGIQIGRARWQPKRCRSATGSRSCTSAGSSRPRLPKNCSRLRSIPIPRRSCRRSLYRIRAFAPTASSSRAKSPTRPIPRRVAIFADRIILQGEVADPANTPPGCHFHPRCKYAQAVCREKSPVLEEIAPNHFVSCHRAKELSLRGVARSAA